MDIWQSIKDWLVTESVGGNNQRVATGRETVPWHLGNRWFSVLLDVKFESAKTQLDTCIK